MPGRLSDLLSASQALFSLHEASHVGIALPHSPVCVPVAIQGCAIQWISSIVGLTEPEAALECLKCSAVVMLKHQ